MPSQRTPPANPLMELNIETAQHRIVLVNGNPVEDTSPDYGILSMMSEGPGWFMEETPREGSLLEEFREVGLDTPTQFKNAVERRCEPFLRSGAITSAECTSVRQEIRGDGSAIFFTLQYTQPGEPERPLATAIRS